MGEEQAVMSDKDKRELLRDRSTRKVFPCNTQILFRGSRMSPCARSSIQVTLWFGLFWVLKATKKNSSGGNPRTGKAEIPKRPQELAKQRTPFSAKLPHTGVGLHKPSALRLAQGASSCSHTPAGNHPPLLTRGSVYPARCGSPGPACT